MLETIFEWVTSGIAELLEILCDWIIENLQMDLSVIAESFPILVTAYSIFQALGVAIVVLIAAFKILTFFKGDISDLRETPVSILIRSVIAIGAIYFGGYVLVMIVNLAKLPYDAMAGLDAVEAGGGFAALSQVGIAVLLGGQIAEVGTVALVILSFIMILCIAGKLLVFAIEVFQRFVWIGVLVYSAPLAFSTLASKDTSEIFKKWTNMFITQCLLMTLTVWMFKAILSAFSYDPESGSPYMLKWLMAMAMCTLAERLDTYLNQLGLNSVTTGRSLLDGISAPFRQMTRGLSGGSSGGVLGKTLGAVSAHASSHGLLGGFEAGAKAGSAAFKNGATAKEAASAAASAYGKAADPLQTNPFTRAQDHYSQPRRQKAAEAAKKNQEASAEYQKKHGKNPSVQNNVAGAAAASQDAASKNSAYFNGAGTVKPDKNNDQKGELNKTAQAAGISVASASKNAEGASSGFGSPVSANEMNDKGAIGGGLAENKGGIGEQTKQSMQAENGLNKDEMPVGAAGAMDENGIAALGATDKDNAMSATDKADIGGAAGPLDENGINAMGDQDIAGSGIGAEVANGGIAMGDKDTGTISAGGTVKGTSASGTNAQSGSGTNASGVAAGAAVGGVAGVAVGSSATNASSGYGKASGVGSYDTNGIANSTGKDSINNGSWNSKPSAGEASAAKAYNSGVEGKTDGTYSSGQPQTSYNLEEDSSQFLAGPTPSVADHLAANYSGSAQKGDGYQQLLENTVDQHPASMADSVLMGREHDLTPGEKLADGTYANDGIGSKLVERAAPTDFDMASGSAHNVSAITEDGYKDPLSGQWVDGGRYVNFDYNANNGEKRHCEIVDEIGYSKMRPAVQQEFEPFKTQSGETAYRRVSSENAESGLPKLDDRQMEDYVMSPGADYGYQESWAERRGPTTADVVRGIAHPMDYEDAKFEVVSDDSSVHRNSYSGGGSQRSSGGSGSSGGSRSSGGSGRSGGSGGSGGSRSSGGSNRSSGSNRSGSGSNRSNSGSNRSGGQSGSNNRSKNNGNGKNNKNKK